jgi:hypothetical protein
LYWLTKTLVDTVCLLRSLSFCLALSCQPIWGSLFPCCLRDQQQDLSTQQYQIGSINILSKSCFSSFICRHSFPILFLFPSPSCRKNVSSELPERKSLMSSNAKWRSWTPKQVCVLPLALLCVTSLCRLSVFFLLFFCFLVLVE